MEHTEQRGVNYSISTRDPTVPDYRPVIETAAGRLLIPARTTIIVTITGDPRVGRIELDIQLFARRYAIMRLEALPPIGGELDLQALGGMRLSNFLRAGLAHRVILEST